MKTFFSALRLLTALVVLTGVAYPLLVTTLGALMPEQASGSLVHGTDGRVIGSALIAQKFTSPKYFHNRPSTVNFGKPDGILGSCGSHLTPNSAALKETVEQRAVELRKTEGLAAEASVPPELLLSSASGVDPAISPESARFQVARVAKARGIDEARILGLVTKNTVSGGLLGPAVVNVLKLNLDLDTLLGAQPPRLP